MQISGEYGTELLIRYTEEQLTRDLERRRIATERSAELQPGTSRQTIAARLAALFGAHNERMPSGSAVRSAGVSQAHAAHR